MKNIWSEIENDSVRDTMRLLGCEEKYVNGTASDFECFCQWLSAFPLLDGNRTAEDFALILSDILERQLLAGELACADPCALWREYNAKKYGAIFLENTVEKQNVQFLKYKKGNCDEKEYSMSNAFNVNMFLEKGFSDYVQILNYLENKYIDRVNVKFAEGNFSRPDRYHAEMILNKIKSDEKCNVSEINLLVSQIILEIFFNKKCRKIQLNIEATDSLSYEYELIKYISARGLGVRVYLLITPCHDPNAVRRVCLLSGGDCFVTPVLMENDTNRFVERLARIYPIGLLGIL